MVVTAVFRIRFTKRFLAGVVAARHRDQVKSQIRRSRHAIDLALVVLISFMVMATL